MKKIINTLLAGAMAAAALTGCAKAPGGTAPGMTPLVLNEVAHSVFYAPQYAAIELGYFEDEGIDLTLVNGGGADKVMTSLISGDAQIGFMGSEASIYVYQEGSQDYAVNFAQLTQRAGNFLVGRQPDDHFKWDNLKGKKVLGGRAGGRPNHDVTFEHIAAFSRGIKGGILQNGPDIKIRSFFRTKNSRRRLLHMANEKPKTLQEQSSPTGPPVSKEVKDMAPTVTQPGKEKEKVADTKSVEAKETEAAGSKKLGDIVKEVKENQQKQTEASPAPPDKKQSASITKISDFPKTGQKKAEKSEPPKKTAAPKKETKEKPAQTAKPGKSKSTVPVSKRAPGASAPAQSAPTHPEPPKEAPRRGEEQIVYLKLNELHAFKNHPFGVRDDEEMRAMVSSVKDKGVTQPAIVRPLEGGGYEIVSGHRRQKASELAGYKDMPCIVRDLTDDEAITQMVADNLNQREEILPSEKAKALKMQLEAIKHQGTRTSGHVDPMFFRKNAKTPA